jgi:hypothetical protein
MIEDHNRPFQWSKEDVELLATLRLWKTVARCFIALSIVLLAAWLLMIGLYYREKGRNRAPSLDRPVHHSRRAPGGLPVLPAAAKSGSGDGGHRLPDRGGARVRA